MGSLKACRICLETNVKMEFIQGALESNIKAVFGHNIAYTRDLPHFTCFECSSLISKYILFRKKYFIAQSVLYNILQKCGGVTENEINCLDRKALNLQSRLSQNSIYTHHWPQIEDIKIEEKTEDIALDMLVEENVKESVDDNSDCPDDDLPLIFSVKLGQKYVEKQNKHVLKSTKKKKMEKAREPFLKDQCLKNLHLEKKSTMKRKDDMLNGFEVTKLSLEEQLAEVEKRQESSNYKDSLYKCDICFKGFLQAETLKNHTVRHDASSGDIECEVCKCRFPTRRAHSLHTARHAKKYACRECDFRTVHSDQAKKHRLWHDGVTYKCQYCDEVSTKLTSYLSHMRMKHTSDFVCEVCGYSYVSLKGLKMHKSRMHKDLAMNQNVTEKCDLDKTDKTNLYCKECKLQFVTREAWNRHMVTSAKHRNDLGNGCRQCGETFPSAAALRAHRRHHAAAAGAGVLRARRRLARARYVPRAARLTCVRAPLHLRYPAVCEHCDEVIPSRSRHWKHYQRSHRDKKYPLAENNYICEICGKGFQANAFLVYHKRTHTDERAYKCPTCPKAFHNRANLHAHVATHNHCRPHTCSVCSKTFKTKLGLQQHFKSHSGMRPFQCEYCGKSFSRAACRALHVTVTHMHARPLARTARAERD